jgi:hypothetical protein
LGRTATRARGEGGLPEPRGQRFVPSRDPSAATQDAHSLMPVRPTKAATGRPSENPAGPSSQEYRTPSVRGIDSVWARQTLTTFGRVKPQRPRGRRKPPAGVHSHGTSQMRPPLARFPRIRPRVEPQDRPSREGLRVAKVHALTHSLHVKSKKPSREAPPALARPPRLGGRRRRVAGGGNARRRQKKAPDESECT